MAKSANLGYPAPFEVVMERHGHLIDRAMSKFFAPPGEEKDDLRQSALRGLWKAACKFNKQKGEFEIFAATSIRNSIADLIRQANSTECRIFKEADRLDAEVHLSDESSSRTMHEVVSGQTNNPETAYLAREWIEEFGEAFTELAPQYQEAYNLAAVNGESIARAADTAGTSPVVVKNRIQAARASLRDCVPVSPI